MEKSKKKTYLLITIVALGAILLTLGITYAYWRLTKEQTGVNVVNSACLDVSIEREQDDISLNNAFPISDEEGLKLTPYKFIITNKCDDYANYNIGLEMLDETNLSSDYVKYSLSELDMNDYELETEVLASEYFYNADDAIYAAKTMDVCQAITEMMVSDGLQILEECQEESNIDNLFIVETEYNGIKTSALGFKTQDSCQSYMESSQTYESKEIITSCEQPEKIYTFRADFKETYDTKENCQENINYNDNLNIIKACESVSSKPYVLNDIDYDEVTTYDTLEECNTYKTNDYISDNCEYRDLNDLSSYNEIKIKTKILGTEVEEESLKLKGTKEGRYLTSGTLKPKESKGYTLRLWLDGDVKVEDDAMNKIFKSKIMIESTIGQKPRSEDTCNANPNSIECYLLKNDDQNQEPQLAYDDNNNLRFIGSNPNNYAYYDCDDIYNPSKETCDLMRIIGVVKDSNGDSYLKLIKYESIGPLSWDSTSNEVNDGNGTNNWLNANINRNILNTYNYDESKCYVGPNMEVGKCVSYHVSFSTSDFDWNIGKIDSLNNKTNQIYETEINSSWNGEIGLINVSDYGYAVGGNARNECLEQTLDTWNTYNNGICLKNNWLTPENDTWTITGMNNNETDVVYLSSEGIKSGVASSAKEIKPVIYLDDLFKIFNEEYFDYYGSIEHPYIIIYTGFM